MANLKEIRAKVASIKSTQKITRAMQMVAASKMRRAQERMAQGRPYAENMHRVIAHLVQANPEYKHRYMVERPVKRVGYIIVQRVYALQELLLHLSFLHGLQYLQEP